MQLKYSVEEIDFHVHPDSGSLIIEYGTQKEVEIPRLVSLELIEVLRSKLYAHSEKSESILNKLFK